MGKCPFCGAPGVESDSPRTVYLCNTSTHDDRPGTEQRSGVCARLEVEALREERDATETRVVGEVVAWLRSEIAACRGRGTQADGIMARALESVIEGIESGEWRT